MKHLEKGQPYTAQIKKAKPLASGSSGWKTIFASLLLITGLGYGMTSFWNSSQVDNVPAAQKAELVTAFSQLDKISVELVKESETADALNSMRLAPNERKHLKQNIVHNNPRFSEPKMISNNEVALAWVELWDFAAVDGDVVSVTSAGYSVTIPLQGMPSRIPVPLDSTGTITIIGIRDGGGGVTLGVQSGASAMSLPVLKVGQTLSLPVAF